MKKFITWLVIASALFLSGFAAFAQKTPAQFKTDIYNNIRTQPYSPARAGDAFDAAVNASKSFYIDGTAAGTNTYTVTVTNYAMTAYVSGQWFRIRFTNANTSGTITLNMTPSASAANPSPSALGAIAVKGNDGNDLGVGDIKADGVYDMFYTGTNLRITNIGGGGSSSTTNLPPDVHTGDLNITLANRDKMIILTGGGDITITLTDISASTESTDGIQWVIFVEDATGQFDPDVTTASFSKGDDLSFVAAGNFMYIYYTGGTDEYYVANGSIGGTGGLEVGTSVVTGGTSTRILYNNAGVLGEYSISGTGNVAMTGSPVFTTPNIGSATGSVSGNAGTATALATPRTINGTSFDGTANITVTAAAGTLTGSTLASGVTASSLTSFGTSPTIVTPSITTGFTIGGSATSRKMVVGNGTNFVASTETWAVPGTSGNILVSDGTNWTSAAAPDIGTHDIFISAAAMWPRATNGCANLIRSEISSTAANIQSLDFDAAADEFAQIQMTLPRSWDHGTITVVFYWTASSGTGNVVWTVAGGAYSDDDALNAAFGTAQSVTDGLTATNDLMISSATSAVTLAGSPADADLLFLQVSRDADNGSDTFSADAKLIGISVRITTDASKDN